MARWRSPRYPRYRRRKIYRGFPRLPRLRLRFPRFHKRLFLVVAIIVSLLAIFSIIDKNIGPAIISIAGTRAHHIANDAINKAMYEKVLANVNYSDLIIIHKDSQQRITMMQANSVRISRIISQANLEIKSSLINMEEQVILVPLGQAFGSRIFANSGPKIKVRIVPYGTVNVRFSDEFQQAGINQVRHILYMNVDTSVKIIIPTMTENALVSSRIPIAESVIVGEVPDTYIRLESSLTQRIIDGPE